MILSVSRRTDIPAFFTEWFFNRLQAEYVLVRNPMNYHQVSRVILTPEVVDCIVFWTKNPLPIIKKLDLLKEYQYYFQITITPYGRKLEPGLPSKSSIIEVFAHLSERIGREKVIWRYDPIILTPEFDVEYHVRQFEILASQLHRYTLCCVISFVDLYKKMAWNLAKIPLKPIYQQDMLALGSRLQAIASKYNVKIESCSEEFDLSSVGIGHTRCIDERLIANILGQSIRIGKDKNQRDICGCAASVDIGTYNTCLNGCLYCYANYSENAVRNNCRKHDSHSPLLIGNLEDEDKVSDRKLGTYRTNQVTLF